MFCIKKVDRIWELAAFKRCDCYDSRISPSERVKTKPRESLAAAHSFFLLSTVCDSDLSRLSTTTKRNEAQRQRALLFLPVRCFALWNSGRKNSFLQVLLLWEIHATAVKRTVLIVTRCECTNALRPTQLDNCHKVLFLANPEQIWG